MIDTLHEIFEAVSLLLIKRARQQRNLSISFEGCSYKAWNLDYDSIHLSGCFCSPLVFQSTAYLNSKWFLSPVWLLRFHTDFQDLFNRSPNMAKPVPKRIALESGDIGNSVYPDFLQTHFCWMLLKRFLGSNEFSSFNVCKWLRREVPSINRALLKGDMCALSFRFFFPRLLLCRWNYSMR